MPPTENLAIEFHDSTIRERAWVDEDLILRMSVYVHSSPGRPGWDAGRGWSQEAELALLRAVIEQAPTEAQLHIWDGSMTVGSVDLENMLPLPWSTNSEVTLRLTGEEGTLVAKGIGGHVTLLGDPGDIEDFSP